MVDEDLLKNVDIPSTKKWITNVKDAIGKEKTNIFYSFN